MNSDYIAIMCTCPDAAIAEKIAAQLVDLHLAACVNIIPGIKSVYQWQGQRHIDQELLLIIKTQNHKMDAIQSTITGMHPYELPEIIALPITAGLPGYLDWIGAQTLKQQDNP